MYPITVNGKVIQTNGGRHNGRKIRELAGVPDDHDLWLKRPFGDDCRLEDDGVIATHPTVSLYSAPREIND